jgi:non-canonical (house-cleaning) NTP pyrophosphatase
MKCYVATNNQRKIEITKTVLTEIFPLIEVVHCQAKSEVSDTPWDDDTVIGAINRAKNALKENPDAELGVGIETGLREKLGKIFEETWCCIVDREGNEFVGFASGNVVNRTRETRIIINDLGSKILDGFKGDEELRALSILGSIKSAATLVKKAINNTTWLINVKIGG